jgi:hypothetical protein
VKFTRAMIQGLAPPPGWLPASDASYRAKMNPGRRKIANMMLSKRASDLVNDYLGHGPAIGKSMSRLLSVALEAYLGNSGAVAVSRKAERSLALIRREWGCSSDDEAVNLSVRYLAQETRAGRVKRIIIEDEINDEDGEESHE